MCQNCFRGNHMTLSNWMSILLGTSSKRNYTKYGFYPRIQFIYTQFSISFQKYHGLDFIPDLLQHMHVQEFTLRPNAENTLREWYSIRRRLNEDLLENTYLTCKDGIRKVVSSTLPVEQTSPAGSLMSVKSTSGSTRSDKRDISSILNKVCLWSSG